jgi:hypothetical protein
MEREGNQLYNLLGKLGVFFCTFSGRQNTYELSPESADGYDERNVTNGKTARVVNGRVGSQKRFLPWLDVGFPGVEPDACEEMLSRLMNP